MAVLTEVHACAYPDHGDGRRIAIARGSRYSDKRQSAPIRPIRGDAHILPVVARGPMPHANTSPSPSDSSPDHGEITALLTELGRGNEQAREPLFETIYDELCVLARSRLRNERRDITLNTTELVHEAYLKLVPIESIEWRDRSHFFATAARAMRRILIDRARSASREKRGGGDRPVGLDEAGGSRVTEPLDMSADALLALEEALGRLGNVSPRQLGVVELRFFAGLSVPETAEVLGIAVNTVKRDWTTARAWLNRELAE